MHSPKKQAGFSLIEIVIAAGLLGVLAYVVVSILRTGTLGQKGIQAQDDARTLTENIASVLSQPEACKATMLGKSPVRPSGDTITEVKDSAGRVEFTSIAPGNKYGNNTLKLVHLTLGGTFPEKDPKTQIRKWDPSGPSSGIAFMQAEWEQVGQSTGAQRLARYFMVYVNQLDPSGQFITECTAAMGGGGGGGLSFSQLMNNSQCHALAASSATKTSCGFVSDVQCGAGEFAVSGGPNGLSNAALQNSQPIADPQGRPVGWRISALDLVSGNCSGGGITSDGSVRNGNPPCFPINGGLANMCGAASALCCK